MRAENAVIGKRRFESRVDFHRNADAALESPAVQTVAFDDVTCAVCQGYGARDLSEMKSYVAERRISGLKTP